MSKRKKSKRPKQLEARIIVENLGDGRKGISCYDPLTKRKITTGLKLWPGEVEARVRDLKRQLEMAGNYVTFAEA
jgi:hypothetical protein